jgi:hypothetical protein
VANVNALTGDAFSSAQVSAAITVADEKIEAYTGQTWSSPPAAINSLADSLAARVLERGAALNIATKNNQFPPPVVELTDADKRLLDSILDTDKDSYASQDFA